MSRLMTSMLIGAGLALAMVSPPPSPAQQGGVVAEQPPEGIEVQARGQVHEAYGEPTRASAVEGVPVDRQPPQAIEEAPPEDRPAGDNVSWISGYWSWDEEAKDFVWVSGFWRVMPPNRTWIPGHWAKVGDSYRRVAGYWSDSSPGATEAQQQEIEYLPPPPALVEAGPSIPAPEVSSTYVPGLWVYRVNRYIWRPGYWIAYRPGWVWVPASYRWSPAGFIFVPGYWDRPLLERGLLFAPVRFTRPLYRRLDFVYRPAYVIQPDFLVGAMFVRPDCSCYYFGDYFAVGYRRRYVPWISYRPNRFAIDLNFGYYRNAYARNDRWSRGLGTLYESRYSGDIPRPPRTLGQQTTIINRLNTNRTSNVVVNNTINITNMQNQTVLSPVRSVSRVKVTGLASLAGPTATVPEAVSRELSLEKASRARVVEEQRGIARNQALSKQRFTTEAKLIARAPTQINAAPVKVQLELPKGTPPARVIRSTPKIPDNPPAEIRRPAPPAIRPITPTPAENPPRVITRPPVTTNPVKPLVDPTPLKNPLAETTPPKKPLINPVTPPKTTTPPPPVKTSPPPVTTPPKTTTSPPPVKTSPPAVTTPPKTTTPPVTNPVPPPKSKNPPPAFVTSPTPVPTTTPRPVPVYTPPPVKTNPPPVTTPAPRPVYLPPPAPKPAPISTPPATNPVPTPRSNPSRTTTTPPPSSSDNKPKDKKSKDK